MRPVHKIIYSRRGALNKRDGTGIKTVSERKRPEEIFRCALCRRKFLPEEGR